mmetsp:Transcript_36120/g.88270  ORF Transcript_36120/g.88270 Transcript_36120/m.88270 type:complete len:124 (-) Transcript_36120:99-470(-)
MRRRCRRCRRRRSCCCCYYCSFILSIQFYVAFSCAITTNTTIASISDSNSITIANSCHSAITTNTTSSTNFVSMRYQLINGSHQLRQVRQSYPQYISALLLRELSIDDCIERSQCFPLKGRKV